MLSYKEYKLLNESLYGAFNLGLRSQGTVGGIVSASNVNGTEAAIEAEAEEAIEEAKKMKKKMDGDDEERDEEEEEAVEKKAKDSDEEGEDSDEDEDSEDDGDEDSDDDEAEDKKKEFAFMKKKMKCGSKKPKKEWSEVMSDLESVLEAIDDEEALTEVKKGLEMMKKGMEKGCGKMMGKKCGKYMNEAKKHHKADCDCPICEKKKDHDEEDKGGEGLTAAQKKLPKALQDAILSKKGKKKGEDKEDKKCGKFMKEEDSAWWKSVNGMLGTADQKGWDGWTEVGEVQQAVRENTEINEISAGLLYGAKNAAEERGDERGQRLAGKFGAAAEEKEYQARKMVDKADRDQILSGNDVVQVNAEGRIVSIVLRDAHINNDRTVVNMSGRAMEAGGNIEVFHCMLRLEKKNEQDRLWSVMYSKYNNDKPIVASFEGPATPIKSIDRKSAMIIAKFVNSHGGDIRPTDLPLS